MPTTDPYTSGELLQMAISGEKIDLRRALATYASPSNWRQVTYDGKCHWEWCGPMIVGFELADIAMRDAAGGGCRFGPGWGCGANGAGRLKKQRLSSNLKSAGPLRVEESLMGLSVQARIDRYRICF